MQLPTQAELLRDALWWKFHCFKVGASGLVALLVCLGLFLLPVHREEVLGKCLHDISDFSAVTGQTSAARAGRDPRLPSSVRVARQ
eukprot:scaffold123456_cov38-Prasinocladus_malaysianus.AAC.1